MNARQAGCRLPATGSIDDLASELGRSLHPFAGRLDREATVGGLRHTFAQWDLFARGLGFGVQVLGEPGLKCDEARKWPSDPHLRVSVGYLYAVCAPLAGHGITMYPMSSDVAASVRHPTMPQFHGQINECRSEMEALGRKAREQNLRLGFHPPPIAVCRGCRRGERARAARR